MTRKLLRIIPLAFLAVLLSACGGRSGVDARTGATPREPVAKAGFKLEVGTPGAAQTAAFTYEQLTAMPMSHLTDVLMEKTHEPDELTSWQGPSLEAILAQAGVRPGPAELTLEALDGYKLRCTRDELQAAVIALQDGDGHWLNERDQSTVLRLVPPALPGNYWIRNLCRITVEMAESPRGS